MDALREELLKRNVPADKLTDDQVVMIARALKLPVPHKVEIIDRVRTGEGKNKGKTCKYVKTAVYAIGEGKEKETARGLYLRVEAIDEAIADLLRAKELLTK